MTTINHIADAQKQDDGSALEKTADKSVMCLTRPLKKKVFSPEETKASLEGMRIAADSTFVKYERYMERCYAHAHKYRFD